MFFFFVINFRNWIIGTSLLRYFKVKQSSQFSSNFFCHSEAIKLLLEGLLETSFSAFEVLERNSKREKISKSFELLCHDILLVSCRISGVQRTLQYLNNDSSEIIVQFFPAAEDVTGILALTFVKSL